MDPTTLHPIILALQHILSPPQSATSPLGQWLQQHPQNFTARPDPSAMAGIGGASPWQAVAQAQQQPNYVDIARRALTQQFANQPPYADAAQSLQLGQQQQPPSLPINPRMMNLWQHQ